MDVSGLSRWTVAVLCLSGSLGPDVRAAAQSIAVSGRVVDAVSGRAVAGVQVTIGLRTIVTDAEGRFQLDVSAGRWRSTSRLAITFPARSPLTLARRAWRLSRFNWFPEKGSRSTSRWRRRSHRHRRKAPHRFR